MNAHPKRVVAATLLIAAKRFLAITLVITATSCLSRSPVTTRDAGPRDDHATLPTDLPPSQAATQYFPQGTQVAIDILFMVDNSGSMGQEQQDLLQAFRRLIDDLVAPQFGGKLPSLHIGVVSSDLGAGDYGLPGCEKAGGDGGKLQHTPRISGCTPPRDPYISVHNGQTNIPGCEGDPATCVKDAFNCIASLGITGCGFESQLESVRRALDPKLNINPGFLRPHALLEIVFLTDEDDCSAQNPQLFDPQHQALTDPLGPLGSFRCFEFGIECDVNDRNKPGPRKNCVPAFDWLTKVDDYIRFFETLKGSKDRVIMGAIAGPTPTTSPKGPVTVATVGSQPVLQPSCQSGGGPAAPAIRLMSVVDAFHGVFVSICERTKYAAALEGPIAATLSTGGQSPQCMPRPLALPGGGVACDASISACKMPSCAAGSSCDAATGLCMKDGASTGSYCAKTCLDKVACTVTEVTDSNTAQEKRVPITKCPTSLFGDPSLTHDACGTTCPCWRLVPQPKVCTPSLKVSPFAFEIMRKGDPEPGAVAEVICPTIPVPWSDPRIQGLPMHCAPLAP
ncbi:MAG: hypothetical protein KAI47_19730 [Deltaproteobacteria bacterium]|nr:hypothetical protein [Deltaproteobacteria bacterium]